MYQYQDEIQEELFRNSATKNDDPATPPTKSDDPTTPPTDPVAEQEATLDESASKHMRLAIEAAKLGPQSVGVSATSAASPANSGETREPFGACIVDTRTGEVIATAGSCRGR